MSKRLNPGDGNDVWIRVLRPQSNKKAPVFFWNFVNRHLFKTRAMKLQIKICFFCQESFISQVCSINIIRYIWRLRNKTNNQDNNIFSVIKTTYLTVLLRFMNYLQDLLLLPKHEPHFATSSPCWNNNMKPRCSTLTFIYKPAGINNGTLRLVWQWSLILSIKPWLILPPH